MDLIDLWFFVGLFLLGLALGSFANVVIWRFPRGESVVSPPSACPECAAAITWRDNVPVLSWLLLRARCRACQAPISARYPIVELLSALLWLVAALFFGVGAQAIVVGIFFWTLLVLTFIDIDTMRLPNPIVGALGVFGAALAVYSHFAAVPVLPFTHEPAIGSPLLQALIGTLTAGGVSLAMAQLYKGVRGRAGMGMGDVKLLAAIGPFLGVYTIGVLFAGSVLGALWALSGAAVKQLDINARIPFGPFLAAAAVLVALFGPDVWHWYVALVDVS
ncbi:MAG: prepilin peptidase [Actinobacteria bacterium]|nr:prepilin peptidase [Actinomycetota bacterium]